VPVPCLTLVRAGTALTSHQTDGGRAAAARAARDDPNRLELQGQNHSSRAGLKGKENTERKVFCRKEACPISMFTGFQGLFLFDSQE